MDLLFKIGLFKMYLVLNLLIVLYNTYLDRMIKNRFKFCCIFNTNQIVLNIFTHNTVGVLYLRKKSNVKYS